MHNDKQKYNDDALRDWDDGLEVVDLDTFDDRDDGLEVVDLNTLDDIDGDAQHARIPSWSAPVLRWQHSFNRRRWRTFVASCSLLLVVLVVSMNLHSTLVLFTHVRDGLATRLIKPQPLLDEHLPKPVSVSPSLVIPLAQNGFSCVTSESWSPDGALIALLGYASGCQYDSQNSIGLATIQDAYVGKRLVQIQPDVLVKKTFYTQFSAIHDSLIINYQNVTWSPDKIHLALLFSLHTKSQIGGAQFSGVLLFDTRHKTSQVFLQQVDGKPTYQISTSSYEEWDIQHGTLLPTPVQENEDPFVVSPSIPAAEEYAWNQKGELLPQTHAPSTHGIGSMVGDPSFSVWQSGGIILVRQDEAGGTTFAPGIFVWNVDFLAWSPDGRYLINGAYLAARLEPQGHPKPDKQTLIAFHLENLPVLPVRDSALLNALLQLRASQTVGSMFQLMVTWAPNGQYMITTAYGFAKKTLYSTKRGFPVATLMAPKTDGSGGLSSHNSYYAFSFPNWSPDSTHLMAQDPGTSAVVVWSIPKGVQ